MQLSTVFFLVNLIGGILVLSSYAWGLWSFPFHRHLIWGDIGFSTQKIIVPFMFLAAIGYIVSAYWFWKIIPPNDFKFAGNFDYGTIILFFSMFLGLSSLWMPMAIQSVISNSPLWIVLTKVILFFVAICSLLILFGIFNSSTLGNQILPGKYFSLIGWFFLCVQTVIFDGIFWSLKFNPH